MNEAASQICVILNPAAGRGQAAKRRSRLEKALAEKSIFSARWDIRETQKAGDATDFAAQAVKQGADLVVAAGGDGTLGEVVNGLAQSGFAAQLGLLPCGTGNDFARCLGIGTNWQKAVDILFDGTTRTVDVGHVHFERSGTEHLFINIAGCGFDALAAQRVNDYRFHRIWRHVRGMPAYLSAVLQELAVLRAAELTIEYDGITRRQRIMLCAIANATSYGGGMLVAPQAQIDDGQLDICLIGEARRGEFLRAFPRVFKGTHISHPKVSMLRGRVITLHSEPPLPVLVDGDVRGTTPVRLWIEPKTLRVRAPK